MGRQPKPWYRKDRKAWCVTVDGKRHNLGPNKKLAFARFQELLRSPRAREPVIAGDLISIIEQFLDWVVRNRAPATYEWYRGRLQSFVDAHPGLTLAGLKPFHVEKWASTPGSSVTTRRNRMRAIKRCLKWAVCQGHLGQSPIEGLEVPAGVSREVYVSPREFDSLLTVVRDDGFADLLRVTYETGCRPQEILRVEARHFDRPRCRWVFPACESKGRAMPRIVYLSESAASITDRLSRLRENGPLFRNRGGAAWTKDAVGCAFGRIQVRMGRASMASSDSHITKRALETCVKSLAKCRRASGKQFQKSAAEMTAEARRKLTNQRARRLAPRYSLYALRHSWATNALRSGLDALTVAVLMGHKDPSTLARTYQHLSHNPEHVLQQAQAVSISLVADQHGEGTQT